MPDCLTISELALPATIGVHRWEQQFKQTLLLDLSLQFDNEKVAQNDSIEKAIDYDGLSQSIQEFVDQTAFALIETLAERIADQVLKDSRIWGIQLTLKKPTAIKDAKFAAITITRGEWQSCP